MILELSALVPSLALEAIFALDFKTKSKYLLFKFGTASIAG
jgi:hypothetical protein